jgi:ribosomal protein S18 acetylase RimI-like enzyme
VLWIPLLNVRIGQYSRSWTSVRLGARSATRLRLNSGHRIRSVVSSQRRQTGNVACDQRDVAETGQGHVTRCDARDPSAGPIDWTPRDDAPEDDSVTLREALLTAVSTSPDAFLATEESLLRKSASDWATDLQESTWVVAEQGGKVVGLAAAKLPYGEDDWEYADEASARFIESVWIDPHMRRHGLGSHLVSYLIEQQRVRDPRVQQFYLWVFFENIPAISLYEQMGFKPTGRSSIPEGRVDPEVQYCLSFDSGEPEEDELAESNKEREKDWANYGLRYRALGSK